MLGNVYTLYGRIVTLTSGQATTGGSKLTDNNSCTNDLDFSPMVQLNAVSRHFGGGRVRAVHKVDLEIKTGQWLTITGSSGSGKSTLLSLISGLDQPSSGEVFSQGRPMNSRRDWSLTRAAYIGLVFQAFHLIPTLTALENVQIPLFGNGLGRPERAERAWALLLRVGLERAVHRRPGELSGGELQRVSIARALANKPQLLLADEPTGNLDSANSRQIIELLKKLHQ